MSLTHVARGKHDATRPRIYEALTFRMRRWCHARKHGNVRPMSARVVAALLAPPIMLVLGACESAISLAIDIPPEDLAAVAIVSADGTPRVVDLRPQEKQPIEVEDGDHAYAFVVAHSELANLDGTPLLKDATRAADVRLDDEPRTADKGTCGFCVLPATVPPQRVAPGDSCPLPPFARALDLMDGGKEIDAASLESLRTRILVDWPGECL